MSSGSPAVKAAIFVAIISAFLPTLAHAQPEVVMTRDFLINQPNPCVTGEMATGTGRQTLALHFREDASGGVHITSRSVTKGQALSAAGPFNTQRRYVLSSEELQEQNTSSSILSFEFTIVVNHVLIRQAEGEGDSVLGLGTGEDFFIKETIHFTVKDFVIKSEVVKVESRCM